jgi:hypothetical protein
MTPERFDAIILGTGQARKPLPLDLGSSGRQHVGGTCGIHRPSVRQPRIS